MIRTYLFIACIFYAGILCGQPQLSVSKTTALIGDQLELTLQILTPGGEEWVNADVQPADTVASIEILETYVPEMGPNLIQKRWTIAVFDTGAVRVPPMPIIMNTSTGLDTAFTNDIPLQISGILDSAGMAPIRPIVHEPVRFSDYLQYIGIGLVLILLVVAGIWWSKRPQKELEPVVIEDVKPAHELALIRLDSLDAQQLWQKGQIKMYHSDLSHIVREYLEGRYGIQALEYTTGEIVTQMRKLDLNQELLDETAQMMQVEDLVKFAKATPPVEVHAEHMTFVRDFIHRTKLVQQTETTDA